MKKIAVVGSGPAGLYTTLLLEKFGGTVDLYEQNKRLGEKLRLTGGGRMNVTNRCLGEDHFSSDFRRNLSHIFRSPWVEKRVDIFAELGVIFDYEGDRAILKSQDANGEVDRLAEKICEQKNARIFTHSKVDDISVRLDEKFVISVCGEEKIYDVVILATGGMYRIRDLGGREKIYRFPIKLDHDVTEDLSPSLSPLYIENCPFRDLSGISVEVTLSDASDEKVWVRDQILLTHFGISGPGVLDFSALKKSEGFTINFLPGENLREKILSLRNGSHRVWEIFPSAFPKRLQRFLVVHALGETFLEREKKVADLSKGDISNLCDGIERFFIKRCKTAPYPACWTTKGGVSLRDVRAHSLMSKKHKNLYFAGEILDVNGLCGGYNITFAAISAKLVTEDILGGADKPS